MNHNLLRWLPARGLMLVLCLCGLVAAAGAQSTDTATAPQAPSKGIEPIFPATNPNLTFVEAEDAVSTNFAREPVLNFGVSGFRALQLNRSSGLEGIGAFYADFVFTIPAEGTWELWYGGTPPGPRDELYPSYTSPFSVTVDAQKALQVTRESVSVAGIYAPAYSWNQLGDLTLSAGRHRITFEVTEKRRIDGRYFFYLDCFFLVRKEGGKRLLVDPLPAVFPVNMDDRKANAPFPAIDDMLIKVRDDPGSTRTLVDLASLYSLLGDYLNALKYLNRAAALKPHDAEISLLIAKNRIWKGDIPEGLAAYRAVLNQDPKQRVLWLEAGKVAAWNGSYDVSIGLYRDALTAFPADLDLTVNLGLAYLWAGRGQDAETTLRAAQAIAGKDSARLVDLGRVYRINGYADRALQAYTAATAANPQNLEAHLLAIDTLRAMGKKNDAEAESKRVLEIYVPSDKLDAALAAFRQSEGQKEQVLLEYETKLKDNPDNLVLRQVLAQAYFWNGLKDKAIGEYRHILANYAYHSLTDAEAKSAPIPLLLDRSYLILDYLSRFPADAKTARDLLAAQSTRTGQASAQRDSAQAALEAAQKSQTKAKEGKETDAALAAVHAAEDKLQAADTALSQEKVRLKAAIETAAALSSQYAQVIAVAQADSDATPGLSARDAEAQTIFKQATETNTWTFDRAGTLAELAQDTADNDLSRIVSAKIDLSDRLSTAAQTLLAGDTGSATASSAAYTAAQSWLWAGAAKNAVPLLEKLGRDPGAAQLPAYFADIAAFAEKLSRAPDPSAQESEDLVAEAKARSADLAALSAAATARRDAAQKYQTLLHTLYRHTLVRAFYAFEQEASSLRNELGDYYLANDPPALDAAIRQFKRVLAVDPGDLNATFRLGKVYEWKRDWKSAQDAYAIVYKADPAFENVAALYNRLERQHADSVASLVSAMADSQRLQVHGDTAWSHSFDSVFSLAAEYQTDDMRILRANATGGSDSSSYRVYDLAVGIPIDLYLLNLKVTPWVGGMIVGDGLFLKTGTVTPSGDQFGVLSAAEPYGKIDLAVGAFNALYLNGTARWGRLPETLDPSRQTALYDASMEANLSTLLSFVDVWPLRDTSLRTYGRVDIVQTSGLAYQNALYTAVQEITINLLKGGSPYGVLAVTGNVTWQNSDHVESYLYYTPSSVLAAGASLTGSLWIGMRNGDTLGLSARAYGGSYQESVGGTAVKRIKGEAEIDASLTTGTAAWNLTVLGSATYNLGGIAQPWDYWSLFVRLGYRVSLPEIFAP